MIRRCNVFITCLVFISCMGCSSNTDAENAVKLTLKDPDSAQFRSLSSAEAIEANYRVPGGEGGWNNPPIGAGVCGEYNSRNSMGGYTGFRKFIWERNTNQVYTANKNGVLIWNGTSAITGEDDDARDDGGYSNDMHALGWVAYCNR